MSMRIFESREHINVLADRLCVHAGTHVYEVRFDAISRVEAYKRDLITTDLICLDLLTKDGAIISVHEELEGFQALTEKLASLPRFDADWYAKVMKPAFVENRTLVYEACQ
jgi:hypothetical protein